MGISLASQCQCYEWGLQENMKHLFFTAPAAKRVWNYFAKLAGIRVEGANSQSMIKEWWRRGESQRLQQVYNRIPSLICWELWQRRNNRRHGGILLWIP